MEKENKKTAFMSDEELHSALNKKLRELEIDDYDMPRTTVEMLEQTFQLA